jgi:hypothetical protein
VNQVPSEYKSRAFRLRYPAQWSRGSTDLISNSWISGLVHTDARDMMKWLDVRLAGWLEFYEIAFCVRSVWEPHKGTHYSEHIYHFPKQRDHHFQLIRLLSILLSAKRKMSLAGIIKS